MLEIEGNAVDEDKVLKRVGDCFDGDAKVLWYKVLEVEGYAVDGDAEVLRYKVLEIEGYAVDEGQVFE